MNAKWLQWLLPGAMVILSMVVSTAGAAVISDIRLEGLQRISAGTVFNYLPLKTGDTLDPKGSAAAIRALYKTGFFRDVKLHAQGTVLVVELTERPAIAEIDISGNDLLETEPLIEGLATIGFAEGQVFNHSILEQVKQELTRQYFSQGNYGVEIDSTITPLERNRVAVAIDIKEGVAARIKQINIVGNRAYSNEDLLDTFKLTTPTLFSFYTKTDQYSKQKLGGDLETLKSWYHDRGYINFRVDSTQVTVTPDKRDIYITINVTEGEKFTVSEVFLAGDLSVEPQELVDLVQLRPGDIFSRKKATETSSLISSRLGNDGYAFANVNTIPDIDEEAREVKVTFYVDPGKRVYVRRIDMQGNTKTRDEVLRRELRQMEGTWIATDKIERSRVRLQRLGYFDEVSVETPPVPGVPDQVDVEFDVIEKASGNFLAGLGFSQSQGVIFNTSLTQNNFLGTGKRVSLAFNNSDLNRTYSVGYNNPYYTVDGISRGFLLSYRETDVSEVDISDYSTDVATAGVNYGIPINENERVRFDVTYERTDLKVGNNPATEVQDFIDEEGEDFDTITLGLSWRHDTRNNAIFPTRGDVQEASLSAAVPGGSLNYYKLQYKHQIIRPLLRTLTLSVKADVAYGDGYGGTDDLPLFEHFFAGGVRSVRGYQDFSLGPRDSKGDPLGGDLRTVGNVEVFIPAPSKKLARSLRIGAFFDIGTVYASYDDFDPNDLRYSVGLGATWLSPMGPLTFSVALPLNDDDDDETQFFQFSLGGR